MDVVTLARRVEESAARVREAAARAGAQAAADWESTAGAAFRERLEAEVARLARTAHLLDEAAAAVHRHAADRERVLAALRALW